MLYVGIATMIFAMASTWALTPPVIRLARRLGALDLPGGRKTHAAPMPRIGGVAVFAGFIASIMFAALLTGTLFSFPRVDVYWQGLIFAAGGLFVIGLIDDLYSVSYRWKFAVQILAGAFVWQCGFRIDLVSNPLTGGSFELGWLSLPVTVLWIVGITNAVNLIDGLDGLAAGVALISTLSVGVIAFYRAELGVTAASVALAGSLIGFLRFNFNPAQIFLGDSGSLFLGFVLAVTSVRGSQKGATAIAVLAPLLILGLPLLDTGLAVARRLLRLGLDGRKAERSLQYVIRNLHHVFLPDRGHIHHRLIDLGLGHRTAVLVLYGVTCLFVLSAFALVVLRSVAIGLLLIGVLFLMMVVFGLITYVRYRRGPEPAAESRKPDPIPLARSGQAPSR